MRITVLRIHLDEREQSAGIRSIPVWLQQCALMCIFEGGMIVALKTSAGRSGLELLGSRFFLIDLAV